MKDLRVLVIIDPQNDFITGSLAVPGATEAMDRLAHWVETHADTYDTIYVSMDQHPRAHCSFASQGGPWPEHCVRYTIGAAIYQPLIKAIAGVGKPVSYIEKATTVEADSYSAFADTIPMGLIEAKHIYIAGLAGDYCVRSSYEDLLRAIPRERITWLHEGIAFIDEAERSKYQ